MERNRSSTRHNYYCVWKCFSKFYLQLDRKPTLWEDRITQPYIYEFYNFDCHYLSQLSPLKPLIVRIYNSLIKAINHSKTLPKYIIVIPDKDIIQSLGMYDYGVYDLLEANVSWLVNRLAKAILTRRDQFKKRRAGVIPKELPKFIWVKMLTQPHSANHHLTRVWKLKSKFNKVLDAVIYVEQYMKVIELNNMEEYPYFTQFGELTDAGQHQFWSGVNSAIKDFDRNPPNWTRDAQRHVGNRRRLPTPPPKHTSRRDFYKC